MKDLTYDILLTKISNSVSVTITEDFDDFCLSLVPLQDFPIEKC